MHCYAYRYIINVNLFIQTLHSICRIAEVLLTLQQVGNVKYTGWVLQVPCSTNRAIINELQIQAKCMEDELQDWKKMVKKRREEFYELNYYTTIQLLALRKELGSLKTANQAAVSREVLALLQSVSTGVNPNVVSSAVSKVLHDNSSETLSEPVLDASASTAEEFPAYSLSNEILSSASMQAETVDNSKVDILNKEMVTSLNEDKLTLEQKEIMANIRKRLNCSKDLVLRCFEECSNAKDEYDLRKWCADRLLEESIDVEEVSDDDMASESDISETSTTADTEEDEGFKYSGS